VSNVNIITRSEWGARPPKSTPKAITIPSPKLYLHHAAGAILPGDDSVSNLDLQRIRSIQDFHMDSRGWNDIAYSFLMDTDGYVFEGRGAGIQGGHTEGQNTVSHAVCIMGNYESQPVDPDLIPRLADLVNHGHERGWWPQGFTGGHRDAPGAATSCPGKNLYSQLPAINKAVLEGGDDMTPEQLETILAAIGNNGVKSFPGGEVNGSVWQNLIRIKADTTAIRNAVLDIDVSIDDLAATIAGVAVDAGVAGAVADELARRLAA
jgi:hypothetical protein